MGKQILCNVTGHIKRKPKDGVIKVDVLYDEINFMKGFVQKVIYNRSIGNDNVILITGEEGTGKSSYALLLAHYIDPNFSATNVAYTMDDVDRILKYAHQGDTIMFDEAGNTLFNRDFGKKENKDFIKKLIAIRKKGITFLMCVPSINSVDLYVRDNRARFWIHLFKHKYQRGYYREWDGDERTEFSENKHFSCVGCSTFRSPSAYPEIKKLSDEYDALKDAYIDSLYDEGGVAEYRSKVIKSRYKPDGSLEMYIDVNWKNNQNAENSMPVRDVAEPKKRGKSKKNIQITKTVRKIKDEPAHTEQYLEEEFKSGNKIVDKWSMISYMNVFANLFYDIAPSVGDIVFKSDLPEKFHQMTGVNLDGGTSFGRALTKFIGAYMKCCGYVYVDKKSPQYREMRNSEGKLVGGYYVRVSEHSKVRDRMMKMGLDLSHIDDKENAKEKD